MKNSALIFSVAAAVLAGSPPALTDPLTLSAPLPLLTVAVRPDVLIVPVTLGGRPYQFLLDTGISSWVIDNALASELTKPVTRDPNPTLHPALLAAGIHTPWGSVSQAALQLWRPLPMAVGEVRLPASRPWLGADLSLLTQRTGIKIDGILGQDIFRRFIWQVDNQTRQLTVWQRLPDALKYPTCVSYQDANDAGPQLVLDYYHRPVAMTVNTGVDYSYIGDELIKLSRERPESAVLTGINQPVMGLRGQEASDGYSLTGLRFNQMPLGKLLVQENKHGALGLGMNFLARFDSYLFMPDSLLFCYREQRFTRDEPAPRRLLIVRYYAQRVELFSNPAGVLARFGLQNGDVLVEVNGRNVQPEELHLLRAALADTPRGQLTLKIERHGRMKTIEI